MPQKKRKTQPGARLVTIFGKKVVSRAAKIQCVKLPSACPSARCRLGKISAMNTQITAPWPIACAAMNAKMQAEREDVTERANIEQRAAAEPVNQPEADKGEDQVGHADADGLEQGGFRPEAGQFEDARCEVENRVDA